MSEPRKVSVGNVMSALQLLNSVYDHLRAQPVDLPEAASDAHLLREVLRRARCLLATCGVDNAMPVMAYGWLLPEDQQPQIGDRILVHVKDTGAFPFNRGVRMGTVYQDILAPGQVALYVSIDGGGAYYLEGDCNIDYWQPVAGPWNKEAKDETENAAPEPAE